MTLVRPIRCVVCGFEVPTDGVGYVLVAPGPAQVTEFVCAPCHDDCHVEFGGVPSSVARIRVGDLGCGRVSLAGDGVALLVRHPPGFEALRAAARRLAYEFSSDFPLAPAPVVRPTARRPGVLEAYVYVSPVRFQAQVLVPLVEAALVVLGAHTVALAFPAAVRRDVGSTIYDQHGPAARRRLSAA